MEAVLNKTKLEVEKKEEGSSETQAVIISLTSEKRAPILLNIEKGVKNIAEALANKETIDGIDADKIAHLPNSITGVIVYFIVEGLKREFNITFDAPPVSLKQRGASSIDKKVAGKKRLLTRDQKNELLSKTQFSYYENRISLGDITMEEAMEEMKAAFNQKREYERIGYMLPEKKTAYPYWQEEIQAA
jgi:hypothetical protein